MKLFLSLSLGGIVTLTSLRADISPAIKEAIQPLEDGVPQVAVVRLKALLADKPSEEDRVAATARLGQALAESNRPEEALQILSDPSVRDLPEAKFFRAQALAAEGKWGDALPLYQSADVDPAFRFHAEALAGAAESYRSLGQIDQSLQTFALLGRDEKWKTRAHLQSAALFLSKNDPDSAMRALLATSPTSAAERKERRFLRGRIESRLGHHKKAMDLFAWILKHPDGAAHPVFVSTLFAMADEHLAARTPETGDDYLEDFIEHHPEDSALPEIFAKLDQLYVAERKQSRHDLARWGRDPAQPRRALAQWYLSRAELRLKRRDLALQTFEQLQAQHPPLPALAEAFLEYAHLELEEQRFDQALAILEAARALHPAPNILERIDFLAADTQFRAGHFSSSAKIFQNVAQTSSKHTNDALFDVSLAWLQAGDAKQFSASERELKEHGADETTRGDLILEQGLTQAAAGDKNAAGSLRNFIRDFPKHPRISEAWVALGELAFHDAPPRFNEARKDLATAEANHPTPAAQERGEYLAIWIEDAAPQPNESKVAELARQFLQKYPESPSAPDVRLKLAEAFYRRQDFANAQTQFALLAQENPNSALAEKAQFFAAESAMQSMGNGSFDQALLQFGEVVKKNGELKWAARNEQAVIERKLGKAADAVTLYDEVLKGDGKRGEKREALCGKGDIFYDLGTSNPENYKRAIEAYDQLAAETEAGSHWHNQALFKKGVCLEKLNSRPEALATFYQIIEDGSRPDRRREFFWFYKAGFNAARLLEEQSEWKPAAAIYEKLAFAGGGRSEEAKSRLNRIRLEHFLWEQ